MTFGVSDASLRFVITCTAVTEAPDATARDTAVDRGSRVRAVGSPTAASRRSYTGSGAPGSLRLGSEQHDA